MSIKGLLSPFLFGLLFATLAGGGAFLLFENSARKAEVAALIVERDRLALELASTVRTLEEERAVASSTVHELSARLFLTEDELRDIERSFRRERERNQEFEDQIREIAGTVGVLDQLAKTDKELLQKYSRVYFLNENYRPAQLSKISDRYVLTGRSEQYFHAWAIAFLEDMLDDARRDGVELRVVSAFRSFDEQSELKGQFTQIYGSGANAFSADQGYSEHQLGTAVDLTDPATNGTHPAFANTKAYEWLVNNAHRYGFVLSYPEGNQFYIFEPWHWRFVGRALASDLKREGAYFYDWDQRRIDEYLIKMFD